MNYRYSVYIIIFTIILLVTIGAKDFSRSLQAVNKWSLAERIPDYYDESRPPELVADQNGTVHVFNYQPTETDGEPAVLYRQWTLEQGWTPPIDVVLSPRPGDPRIQGVFLDRTSQIHLIFFGGNELGGAIYYSKAMAAGAGQARSWLAPEMVGPGAGPLPSAALAGDDHGNLFILYTGNMDGMGLYEVHSTDGGNSWSDPVAVAKVYDDLQPWGTRLTVDPQGHLHAVWSLVDFAGVDREIYYARLEADLETWGEPIVLAEKDINDYKAAWPAIIFFKNELMVVYMDSRPATRWMRRSNDGGLTWSDPVRPWPHEGEYEHVVLLVDSNDVLHAVLGNRTGDCCHGMWHGIWQGGNWSALEPVVMSPKSPTFDPSAPRAVISQGNTLLVTWWTDTGGGPRNGAWYSYTVLDAPRLPIVALPTLPATPAPTATITPTEVTPTPVSTVAPRFVDDSQLSSATSIPGNPALPVILGVVPIILLIALVIVGHRIYYHTLR